MKNVKSLSDELRQKLQVKEDFNLNMIIGLDGFVDEIIHIVDKRLDSKNYTRISTIAEFGKRVSNAAGLSTNIEFVPVQTKLGGNGPIFANALLEYGVSLTYVGMLGKPSIHPVFQEMVERSKAVYSLCEPGHSDACEFEDGKIIIGKHASLREMTWDLFRDNLGGPGGIAKLIEENNLLGMENWTMLPYMSDIWEGIISEVFPLLSDRKEKPFAFFDLADPEKRTKEDICHAMGLISKFEEKFRAILGLNEKEAYEIAEALGIEISEDDPDKLKTATMAIYEKMDIYCLMVHPVSSACCVIDGEYYYTEGPYCRKPKLTTGAGDNFNAGFCIGQVIGLDPISSLALGACSSGFYVRNGHSPSFEQVLTFAEKWFTGNLED